MAIFTKESLETLKTRIDIVEVISGHIDLKKAGAVYKALCPFHDEKSPSFTVDKSDSHYHCFGCGAHGDAIGFLMQHARLSFTEAVEHLAQKFHVMLQKQETSEEAKGPPKSMLKEAMGLAADFYHFYLLRTKEGSKAVAYLRSRGLHIDFIEAFQIGLAPQMGGMMRAYLTHKGATLPILEAAGLMNGNREFFADRILFPIRDPAGAVIAFSGRKYQEETFGGKYVNTPETPLFKKSRVLFGFNYCRKRIAKERKVVVVEGQIDALRLIHAGFDFTVAGQGTAFGEGHVAELAVMGVHRAFLALDGDLAGQEALFKIGNLFQREGIEVHVVAMPPGEDPDTLLRKGGVQAFQKLLDSTSDYLTFLVHYYGKRFDLSSPAGKQELLKVISQQIRAWDKPLLVHESLRKLAKLTQVPENLLGVGQEHIPNLYVKRTASLGEYAIDPDQILESNFLRALLETRQIAFAEANIPTSFFQNGPCRQIYEKLREVPHIDLLTLNLELSPEAAMSLTSLLDQTINTEKAADSLRQTMQKILDRNWIQAREAIKMDIQSGSHDDEKVMELARHFGALKTQPKIQEPVSI